MNRYNRAGSTKSCEISFESHTRVLSHNTGTGFVPAPYTLRLWRRLSVVDTSVTLDCVS